MNPLIRLLGNALVDCATLQYIQTHRDRQVCGYSKSIDSFRRCSAPVPVFPCPAAAYKAQVYSLRCACFNPRSLKRGLRPLRPPLAARPPLPVERRNDSSRRGVVFGTSDAGPSASLSDAVHTVHVQVPVAMAATPSNINMSLRLNISASATSGPTSSTNNTDEFKDTKETSYSSSASSAVIVPAPAPAASAAAAPPYSPKVSTRKSRKVLSKKSSSKEKDGTERQSASSTNGNSCGSHAAALQSNQVTHQPPAAHHNPRLSSPFEKLNTLKMLLDCGHLTEGEYQERKTQIINEMTGTSTERLKKPSPKRPLQPIMKTVVPHQPPDFSRIPKERAEKLSFDVDTLEWHATATRIKLDLVPFATGQLRNAYFLQEWKENEAEPQLLVAKFTIRPADPSSYLSDVEMQAVCAHYAALYNEHVPPLKVYYARSWLFKLKDRGDLVCSVEEYLPGSYVKYSNNNGYVGKETSTTEERERNTPHAYSHFTFVASDYRLMVVDIQGVNDSYTDPQIHTADGRGFGAGNLGTFGMEKFLESHRCNEVCRWLGLKSINKQYKPGGTAAPEYQMPFGGKIKKSTNRITEERNTFSRSVTVSEAFGGSAMLQGAIDDDGSVSTTATGSSSLVYGQPMPQPFSSPKITRSDISSAYPGAPMDWRSKAHRVGIVRHVDEEESRLWLLLRRLVCCCLGS